MTTRDANGLAKILRNSIEQECPDAFHRPLHLRHVWSEQMIQRLGMDDLPLDIWVPLTMYPTARDRLPRVPLRARHRRGGHAATGLLTSHVQNRPPAEYVYLTATIQPSPVRTSSCAGSTVDDCGGVLALTDRLGPGSVRALSILRSLVRHIYRTRR